MQPSELSKPRNPIDDPRYQSPPAQLLACSSDYKGISHENKQKNNNLPFKKEPWPTSQLGDDQRPRSAPIAHLADDGLGVAVELIGRVIRVYESQ